jgi:hypothetical protein
MLAMTFISILLVAIAVTIIQISNIYNHGITLKEVNQAGRSLAADLQRSVRASSQFDISNGGNHYIQQGDWGGRLCLGNYSYIWNYGKAINDNDPNESNLNVYTSDTGIAIRFVKVIDPSSSYCLNPAKKVEPSEAIDLVNVGDHNLAVHNFTVTSGENAVDTRTGQRLYSIKFVIGTNDTNALDGGVCKSPGTPGADPSYCSVQEFNVVARAGNAVE